MSDDGGRPSESTSTITVSSIDTDEPAEPHAKILAEEAVTKDEVSRVLCCLATECSLACSRC